MSSKIKLVYLGVFLVILLFNLIIYSVIKPRIKFDIKGEQTIHVEVNSLYKDLGADASLYTIFQNKKLKVTTTENVNVNKIGKYKVNYQINVDKGIGQLNLLISFVFFIFIKYFCIIIISWIKTYFFKQTWKLVYLIIIIKIYQSSKLNFS